MSVRRAGARAGRRVAAAIALELPIRQVAFARPISLGLRHRVMARPCCSELAGRVRRSGWRPRSSPAGRSRSSRRQGPDCSSASRAPGRLASSRRQWRRTSPAARSRSATAARRPAMPATAATSRQIGARELLARRIEQVVGGADRHRQAVGEGEQPFRRAVDDAEHRRQPGGRCDPEMRVDDGAEFGRPRQIRASATLRPPAALPGRRASPGPQRHVTRRRNRAPRRAAASKSKCATLGRRRRCRPALR